MIALYTGLRRGELLALEWSDIDLDNKTLNVSKSVHFLKNGKAEIGRFKTKASAAMITIPDLLVEILKRHTPKHRLVCPSTVGTVMCKSTHNRARESYMHYLSFPPKTGKKKKGGKNENGQPNPIARFTMHQFRHSCATILFECGVDELTAQKQLCHKDASTTLKIYTHLRKETQITSLDALNHGLESKIRQLIS